MAAAPILSWEGLSLQQGSGWLFRDLDLTIAPRDRLALIGRNGAGKTTLLRLISGQLEADKGKRSIQPGTKIVVLEQDPFFTGFDTLMDFALHGPDAPQRHEVEAIAGQLGIDMGRSAASASGGERRRAALARALAAEPDLLICDEITSALDVSVQGSIVALLEELRHSRGISMLFVTHNLALVRSIAARVQILQAGRVVESGPVVQVMDHPQEEYTKKLLSNSPRID